MNQLTTQMASDQWKTMRDQAEMLVKSGFLPPTINTPEKAIAIMLQGAEIHVGPMASFAGIQPIQGKPTISPQLMLAIINRSGLLEDMSIEDDGNTCTVTMKRVGRKPHTSTFSMADATAMGLAGKDNWKKQPKVMRQWRTVAANCRVTFPDVISGMYTPEEMGADVNDEGEIVEGAVENINQVAEREADFRGYLKAVPPKEPQVVMVKLNTTDDKNIGVVIPPDPAEQSRVVIEEVRAMPEVNGRDDTTDPSILEDAEIFLINSGLKKSEEPTLPRLYDIEKLHYKDEADKETGEVVTYVSINGAWLVAGNQVKPADAKKLEKLFEKDGRINEFEVKGSIKKHFSPATTLYTLTYEEAAALYLWKKEGVPDPRWYQDKIKVEVDDDQTAILADREFYTDTWKEDIRAKFIENLRSIDDPLKLKVLFHTRGWDATHNQEDFLALYGLLASGVIVWDTPECEEVIKGVEIGQPTVSQ